MTVDSRVAGSLFIDMKYTSLYHKLGYRETNLPNYNVRHYDDCDVFIESEAQYFLFNDEKFGLTRHEDFVILELLDRILDHGYTPNNVKIKGFGIEYHGKDHRISFICETWGNNFENRVYKDLPYEQVIYTSRLNGGLVEYKNYSNNPFGNHFFFEREYENHTLVKDKEIDCLNEFVIRDGRLYEYRGTESVVSIPEGITYIDNGVFWDKQFIEEIILPYSLKVIGGDAFAYCENITKIKIPENVIKMGDNPFGGCVNLRLINNSSNFSLKDDVLFTRDLTHLIHYSPWKSDKEYTIDDSVEWIGKHSFYKCVNLNKIVIGCGVNYMGNNSFSDCFNLILENNSPNFQYVDGALLSRDMSMISHYSLGAKYEEYKVPDTVKTIGRNSFWNCTTLKKIIIGKNVRQIGYNPFANCLNLRIESNCTHYSTENGILYDSSFNELICCSNEVAKEGVTIPNTVKNIGRNAFSGCESLRSITIPASVEIISRGAFTNCINLNDVNIEGNIKIIDKWAFAYCDSLNSIKINSDADIHPDAFIGSVVEVSPC